MPITSAASFIQLPRSVYYKQSSAAGMSADHYIQHPTKSFNIPPRRTRAVPATGRNPSTSQGHSQGHYPTSRLRFVQDGGASARRNCVLSRQTASCTQLMNETDLNLFYLSTHAPQARRATLPVVWRYQYTGLSSIFRHKAGARDIRPEVPLLDLR